MARWYLVSALNLERIKARTDAATAGPWSPRHVDLCAEDYDDHDDFPEEGVWWIDHAGWVDLEDDSGLFATRDDAAFIAHARTDVPALVAEIEGLRTALLGLAECHSPGLVRDELLALAGESVVDVEVVEVDGAYL